MPQAKNQYSHENTLTFAGVVVGTGTRIPPQASPCNVSLGGVTGGVIVVVEVTRGLPPTKPPIEALGATVAVACVGVLVGGVGRVVVTIVMGFVGVLVGVLGGVWVVVTVTGAVG